ncbi:TonB-dependent receptor family protein [Kriegella aquimaris]|uniref:Iron complex outermembrane recepter protein n=1 Tax=Kriegella aquimaris TaxID=192904 RepID=A0A1G9LYY8_9FLAO|nr:TonB-dependent receptor [Kriegella aquimaris]SDL66887.1 iron complex outermembrane recepter protein [Kriegella aquimaris]
MKTIFIFIFLLLSFTLLFAQDPAKTDSITQLDEVILLDALKTKNATGITTSEVIGAKTFQNYSPVDIVSAINQVPGVYILSGALNTNRITIRGIGARTLFGTDKLRLYYNDIPVTNGSGFSTIEAYDLENLSQVEVIKGPKGSAFGANLGGAIILNPKEAIGRSTNISNNLTVGSFGLLKNNLSFNHYDGKLRLGLQYGHMETDGYRENSNFERDGLLLNAAYQINEKNSLSLLVNHIEYTAQIPSSLGATAFAENPKQAAFTWRSAKGYEANKYSLIGLNYTNDFSEKLKNSTSIFYTYLDHYEPRPFGILDEFTNGYGFRTRFIGYFNKGEYTFGGELYKDEYSWSEFDNQYEENNGQGSLQGDRFAQNKEFRSQWNAFGTALYNLTEAFSAQVGLNINKTDYDFQDLYNMGTANKSADRSFKAIVLPSLDLNYRFSGDQQVYANISRGFSNPSLEETLTPDGVINPDIAQETGVNYELGTHLFLHDKRFYMNLALYQMDIKNLLVAQRVGDDQFIGKNAGKTRHRGLEITMNYRWELSPQIQITPFVNYTLSDHEFMEFIDGDDDFSGNPLTGVPKQRRTAGLQTQFFNDFYWNIVHQHVSEIPLTDANTLESEAFTVFTTRLGYSKKLSERFTVGIDFGVNNVFDKVYARSVLINTQGFGGSEPRYYYPGDARNFYGSLRLGYRL